MHFLELNMHLKVLLHFTYRIYPFSFISIVLLHNADQGQTMTHDTAVRSHAVFRCGAREKEQELRVLSSLICHLIASKKQRYTRLLWRRIWPCLGFSSSVTSQSSCSSFTAVLLLVSEHLVYFCPLFSSGTFLHLILFSSFIHPCNLFFFLGLKMRIISSDLIGSVVQVYFCQYFHWLHHRKNCIVFLRTIFMCVRTKYIYIFN